MMETCAICQRPIIATQLLSAISDGRWFHTVCYDMVTSQAMSEEQALEMLDRAVERDKQWITSIQ